MRLITVILIVIALGVSSVAGFLLLRFTKTSGPVKVVEHEVIPAERVLVAKVPLRIGLVLKQDQHFEWRPWPKDGLDPSYVVESSGMDLQFVGAAVIREVVMGEPITSKKVIRPGEQSMLSVMLTPGMRAATVPVNVQAGVAGFVSPGDRVDLILITGVDTISPEAQPKGEIEERRRSRQFGEVILTNLHVLAIDQSLQNLGTGTRVGKTVTFEVTPKQAEILAVSRTLGELYLVLRSKIPPLTEPPAPEFPFTSELEILQSTRTDINESYVTSLFGGVVEEEEVVEPVAALPDPPEPDLPTPREVTITRGVATETLQFPVEEAR